MKRLIPALAVLLTLGILIPAQAATQSAEPSQRLKPSQPSQPRVVGGSPVPIEEVPWQAYVVVRETTVCGGSIVDTSWVLTAAHCVNGVAPQDVGVYTGIGLRGEATPDTRTAVTGIGMHPGYSPTTYVNDLALLQLAVPITPGPTRAPVQLPITKDPNTWPEVFSAAMVTGWGAQSYGGGASEELQKANVNVLAAPGAPCGLYGNTFQPQIHLCAGVTNGGIDTCQGDSGGPLVVRSGESWVLAGVTSIGNRCGLVNYPGVYGDVAFHLPWIRSLVPAAAPKPTLPELVTVEAVAQGRLVVRWKPGATTYPDLPVTFTATADPSAHTCTSTGVDCVIADLEPGQEYNVRVSVTNPFGTVAPDEPQASAIAVSAVTPIETHVKRETLLRWAGIPAEQRASATAEPYDVCSATLKGGIWTRGYGTCVVDLTSKGATQRVYVEVRDGSVQALTAKAPIRTHIRRPTLLQWVGIPLSQKTTVTATPYEVCSATKIGGFWTRGNGTCVVTVRSQGVGVTVNVEVR